MELALCPVKIPNKGDKLHMIAGRIVFIRSVKKLNYYYDVATKVQLCVADPSKHDYVISMIERRVNEIRDYEVAQGKQDGLPNSLFDWN